MDREPEPTAIEQAGRDDGAGKVVFPPEFRHVRPLGAGGMGSVHLVEERATGRRFALKTLRGRAEPEAVRRFVAEARAIARLGHPDVISVQDGGVLPSGQPYYLMPALSGRPLDEALADLDLPSAVRVLVRVARAVGSAHAVGIVHRDLKPANVMVGDHGEVWVVDWGLARLPGSEPAAPAGSPVRPAAPPRADARTVVLVPQGGTEGTVVDRTRAGSIMGSAGYMPPEQARGEVDRIGPASDVHALGAILYQMLTGARPWEGANASTVLALMESAPIVPPAGRAPDREVPGPLASIAMRSLAREPSDRYGDANVFARELERYLAGREVDAHRYAWRERAAIWLDAHLAAVSATLLAAVGLAVLAILYVGRREEEDRRRVEMARAAERVRADLAASDAEALADELDACRDAHRALAAACREASSSTLRIHTDASRFDPSASFPDPESILEGPLRAWRTHAQALAVHLETLSVRAGELASSGVDLPAVAAAALAGRERIEAELRLQDLEWEVAAAVWVEHAALSSERLTGFARSAALEASDPLLAPEYRRPLAALGALDEATGAGGLPPELAARRAAAVRTLSAVAELSWGSVPPGASARLARYDTSVRSPVFRLEDVAALDPAGGRLDLPIGSYLVVLERGGDRFRFPVLLARPLPAGWFDPFEPDRIGFEAVPAGPLPEGLVWCPGGRFRAGGDAPNGLPPHWAWVPPFWIGRTESTWRELLPWLREVAPGSDLASIERAADQAVSRLSWQQVSAFARWRAEREGRSFRLPTELEWEYAARGADGRRYPWGDGFDASRAALERDGPAGSHAGDESPLGVLDLAGSRREWTSSDWQGAMKMVRGGGVGSSETEAQAATRYAESPEHPGIGLRLAADP